MEERTTPASGGAAAASEKKCILVVEDNELLSELLAGAFSERGWCVEHLKDGSGVLERLARRPPDLLLLDLSLPEVSGYEILEQMAQRGLMARVPTVVISNSGEPVQISRIHSLGVVDYIVKADLSIGEVIEKVARALAHTTSASRNLKVLVVEDDADLSELAVTALQSDHTIEVSVADSGEKAWEMLQKSIPDIVLIDIVMPGMSGFDLLKKIRADERYANVACVMFTNLGQDSDKEKAVALGADAFYVKANIPIAKLGEVVRAEVEKKREERART